MKKNLAETISDFFASGLCYCFTIVVAVIVIQVIEVCRVVSCDFEVSTYMR